MSTCNLHNLIQCDLCVLNLLRTHLMHEEESDLERSQIQHLLAMFRVALAHRGVIKLSKDGTVQFMTQQAEQLLNQYFPLITTLPKENAIPPQLVKWFNFKISQLEFKNDDFSLYSILHIEHGEKELNIRLILGETQETYLLLLEEKKKSIFSIADLELIGLTKREAEVLFWVSKDKGNTDIGKNLMISEGTVRKHLEHIYVKLGVQTRTGAVIFALEKLGILQQ